MLAFGIRVEGTNFPDGAKGCVGNVGGCRRGFGWMGIVEAEEGEESRRED